MRGFILYFIISALLIGVLVFATLMGMTWKAILYGLGVPAVSAVVFGYFVASSRKLWKKPSYWLLTSCLFCAHCLVLAFIFIRVGVFKPIWLLLATPELFILVLSRDMFLLRSYTVSKRERRSNQP
jgi:hypothetical protein